MPVQQWTKIEINLTTGHSLSVFVDDQAYANNLLRLLKTPVTLDESYITIDGVVKVQQGKEADKGFIVKKITTVRQDYVASVTLTDMPQFAWAITPDSLEAIAAGEPL